jgi:hypothetical protein
MLIELCQLYSFGWRNGPYVNLRLSVLGVKRFLILFITKTEHVGGSWNMMASCDGSCIGKNAANLNWFKISEDNYNPETKVWPMAIPGPEVGIARKFTLPTNLPGGEYLLSCTLLAVHSVDRATGKPEPQYYPTAWRIKLAESGVKTMPAFESDEVG